VGRFFDDIRRLGFTEPNSTLKDPSPYPYSYNDALAHLINYAHYVKDDVVTNSHKEVMRSHFETLISRLPISDELKRDFTATIGEIYINPVVCNLFAQFPSVLIKDLPAELDS
jgi:hypothetical protein